MTDKQQIASGLVLNATSTAEEISRYAHLTESHLRTLLVSGTFGGATVKYEISIDNVTFFDVANADAIIAAKAINVEHRARYHRIETVGGDGTTLIDAWVI